MTRRKDLLGGPASAALVLAMLAGSLLLWVGVPLGWLWVGSQIQGAASLGAALAATMAGIVVTVVIVMGGLAWLNRRHLALQERRRRGGGASALEVILVSSAGLAVVLFGIWFFGFAGTSPLPLNIGY